VRARLAAGEAAGGGSVPAEAGQRGVGGLEGVHKVRGRDSEVRTEVPISLVLFFGLFVLREGWEGYVGKDQDQGRMEGPERYRT
jgi:hypothetical protein